MSERIPWRMTIVTCESPPADAIKPADVKADDWVRIVPYAFGSYDLLDATREHKPPNKKVPPRRFALTVDRKCVAPLDFYCESPNLACSEAVLRALEKLGCGGWTAHFIPHGSNHAVRGHALYDLELSGTMGAPLQSSFKGRAKKATPFGVAGTPSPPVTLDGRVWTGEPLCLGDWLKADTIIPCRPIIARGDFIHALREETSNEAALILQPVSIEELKKNKAGKQKSERAKFEPAISPWKHPSRWKGSVLDRIQTTAAEYKHSLPGPADPKRLKKIMDELCEKYACRFDPLLQKLLLMSNGPSLFDGLLTFFSIGPRTQSNPVPVHAHSVPPEDIVLANNRVSETDWMITRAPGSILFAARYSEMHAMWALTAEGNVRLLPQTGEILGPDIPFESWLEDQVADLEWATQNRGALGQWEYTWLR